MESERIFHLIISSSVVSINCVVSKPIVLSIRVCPPKVYAMSVVARMADGRDLSEQDSSSFTFRSYLPFSPY